MTITIIGEPHPNGGSVYKFTATSNASAEVSQWLMIPAQNVGVDIVVTTGSAVVQINSAAPSECAPPTPTAAAFDWDAGAISAGSSRTGKLDGASAVRLSCDAGTVAKMYVRLDKL